MIYHGPREHLLPYFARAGYTCPPLYNPADFFMDLIAADVRSETMHGKSMSRVEDLVRDWKNRKVLETTDQDDSTERHEALSLGPAPAYTPLYIAVPVILERTLRNTWRQQDIFWTRYVWNL